MYAAGEINDNMVNVNTEVTSSVEPPFGEYFVFVCLPRCRDPYVPLVFVLKPFCSDAGLDLSTITACVCV